MNNKMVHEYKALNHCSSILVEPISPYRFCIPFRGTRIPPFIFSLLAGVDVVSICPFVLADSDDFGLPAPGSRKVFALDSACVTFHRAHQIFVNQHTGFSFHQCGSPLSSALLSPQSSTTSPLPSATSSGSDAPPSSTPRPPLQTSDPSSYSRVLFLFF
ncbi:uncharacterized protein MONOS_14220 [Monocercomonoides exilis]|uniref:uncharacterized protein n=1 Tax=Monocercomonoides exilis TaxID=2049356 RepID=UPI00355962D1|nr:hypothetical protein MONOS_14220 [Monocercomonoides exilis]|eukprot:MONOS_14220.1-p1 / transcript=MONOS_14220.1 / gene=MONOS_14220 / organism=Monocercomonoides_exilis_PA203 / gene_product=unspecified product / transcript_product=unspecified product / location=Mono_scaffold00958:9572-10048(-) / protein_length=159 / sequence_SO=supercontig / SO=protein_coding / is_pseudo=false